MLKILVTLSEKQALSPQLREACEELFKAKNDVRFANFALPYFSHAQFRAFVPQFVKLPDSTQTVMISAIAKAEGATLSASDVLLIIDDMASKQEIPLKTAVKSACTLRVSRCTRSLCFVLCACACVCF